MQKPHNKFVFKPIVSIGASFLIAISLGVLGYKFAEKKPNIPLHIKNSTEGIHVSKLELPKNTTAAMDMIGLIVSESHMTEVTWFLSL